MNKRGVSPLVATVLLLVFALGLGVLVMNWGRAQIESAAKCSIETGLDIVKIDGVPEVCFAGTGQAGFVHFIVENGAAIDIEALQLRIIGKKGIYNAEIREPIQTGFSLLRDMPYNFNDFGEIRQVKISPKIILYPGNPAILCPEQAVVLDKIRKC